MTDIHGVNARRLQILVVTSALLTMIVVGATPAYAGTLTSASFTTPAGYAYTSSQNTHYDWAFTTATTATLSKVTMGVPAGTGGTNRYLALNGTPGNYASTPDSAANSVTGDIDIRVKAALAQWIPGGGVYQVLAAKRNIDLSYNFYVEPDGRLELDTSPDGSSAIGDESTIPVPTAGGATTWVRATLDVNDGSGNRVTTFYTSNDGSSWSQLGTTVTTAGVTTIFDSAESLELGANYAGTSNNVNGKIYAAEIRNGIGGSVVNKFDPAEDNPASPSSWASSTGEAWTVNRSGTDLPADIATDLSVGTVTGLASGGTADYRLIDGVATYNVSSPASVPSSTAITINLSGFTNTTAAGNYTSLITTYNNAGPPVAVDSATTAALAFADAGGTSTTSVTVDASFTFTVAGRSSVCNGQSATNFQTGATATAVSLGHLSSATVGGGAQDLSVATNAANGFSVYLRTSGTTPHSLRDGSGHSIADVSGTAASPGAAPAAGTARFGYTSSDTSTSFTSNTWAKLTSSNDTVLVGTNGTPSKSACIGYEVAVATTTPAGAYSNAVIYTAVPAF